MKTAFGDVKVKLSTLPDGSKRWKTEHDDINRFSRESSKPYPLVKERVDAQVREWLESRE